MTTNPAVRCRLYSLHAAIVKLGAQCLVWYSTAPVAIGAALGRVFSVVMSLPIIGTILHLCAGLAYMVWTMLGWLLFAPIWIFLLPQRSGPFVDRDTSCFGILLAWMLLVPITIANTWVWFYLAYLIVEAN